MVKKYIIVGILLIVFALLGCNKHNSIDTSNLDEDTIYSTYTPEIIGVNGKVYKEEHEPLEGIYKYENGQKRPIYQGKAYDLQSYDRWLYFLGCSQSNHYYLYRYDTSSEKIETIKEEDQFNSGPYIICPEGIFWYENHWKDGVSTKQIKWSDLDGTKEKVLLETNEGTGKIDDIYIYHHSLYFNIYYHPESPDYHTEYYRLDLETGHYEKPENMQPWKVGERTKIVTFEDGKQVQLGMYDSIGKYMCAKDGWVYFGSIPYWLDPETHFYDFRSEGPWRVYKMKEDGSEIIDPKIADSEINKHSILGIRGDWVYYSVQKDNSSLVMRKYEDGSNQQTIINAKCTPKNIDKNYLYFSYGEGNQAKNNLYRINLDNLSEIEKIY